MAHLLGYRCRGDQLDVPLNQTLALLQRQGPLSPDEADRLESGLELVYYSLAMQPHRFLEAGGLVPLLERVVRPGANQLLERAVGSCPPVVLPPISTGVLVPRPVLIKFNMVILVEVGRLAPELSSIFLPCACMLAGDFEGNLNALHRPLGFTARTASILATCPHGRTVIFLNEVCFRRGL